MRIAMLASGHVVDDARVTQKQATSLAQAGHDVVVFGSGGAEQTSVSGLSLVHILSHKVRNLRDRARVMPKLYSAAVAWKPDVVTCHEPESALVGIKVAQKTNAKMIFDVHELYHETLSWRMPTLVKPLVKAGVQSLLRHIASRADWITVVSPANRDFYLPIQPQGRVDIIHNSPRPEWFPPCNHDISEPITLMHEGYLGVGRGMVQMLKGLAEAQKKVNVRLHLLGRILPQDQVLFEQTAAELHLAESITGPEWINYSELGQSLSQGQIGIVAMQPTPNNYLSLSNKLYNYMACGMALIVPKGSASADLVDTYESGIAVDTTDPNEIAKAIVTLTEDHNLRKSLGSNGRQAIENNLGWHIMEEKLLGIYEQSR